MTSKNKGLTLIEIIIVVFLFSIILAAIFSAMATARNSCASSNSLLSINQEARKGINTMIKELRQARLSEISGAPADGINYPSITFQIPETITASGATWSSNIQYFIGGLNNKQLIRSQDGLQKVLANDLLGITFNRAALEPDVITISISVQRNTFPGLSFIQSSVTFDSEVKVRN